MLIATWNVNSIRTRINQVEDFLNEVQPDLICLQETKVDDKLFPKSTFEKKGYYVNIYGQKAYNGVALISRSPLEDVRKGMKGELEEDNDSNYFDQQKRVISALIDGVRVINLYVPNGASLNSEKYNYKLKWLAFLRKYIQSQLKREEPLCLLGDFNIALEAKDIYKKDRFDNGIMASKLEREALKSVLDESNLEDVFRIFEQNSGHWSWWDYRSGSWQRDEGWRIDHIYLSTELIANSRSCMIHKKTRANLQPSDHAPVLVDISWPPLELEDPYFLE